MDGIMVIAIGAVITIFLLAFGKVVTMWHFGTSDLLKEAKELRGTNNLQFDELRAIKKLLEKLVEK